MRRHWVPNGGARSCLKRRAIHGLLFRLSRHWNTSRENCLATSCFFADGNEIEGFKRAERVGAAIAEHLRPREMVELLRAMMTSLLEEISNLPQKVTADPDSTGDGDAAPTTLHDCSATYLRLTPVTTAAGNI